jgi:hypothetical protein
MARRWLYPSLTRPPVLPEPPAVFPPEELPGPLPLRGEPILKMDAARMPRWQYPWRGAEVVTVDKWSSLWHIRYQRPDLTWLTTGETPFIEPPEPEVPHDAIPDAGRYIRRRVPPLQERFSYIDPVPLLDEPPAFEPSQVVVNRREERFEMPVALQPWWRYPWEDLDETITIDKWESERDVPRGRRRLTEVEQYYIDPTFLPDPEFDPQPYVLWPMPVRRLPAQLPKMWTLPDDQAEEAVVYIDEMRDRPRLIVNRQYPFGEYPLQDEPEVITVDKWWTEMAHQRWPILWIVPPLSTFVEGDLDEAITVDKWWERMGEPVRLPLWIWRRMHRMDPNPLPREAVPGVDEWWLDGMRVPVFENPAKNEEALDFLYRRLSVPFSALSSAVVAAEFSEDCPRPRRRPDKKC